MRIDGMDAVNRTQVTPTISTRDIQPIIIDSTVPAVDSIAMQQPAERDKKEYFISDKALADAIDRVNKAISGSNRQFEFSVHKKTKQIMVKVIDTDTKEVVREIPPEKLLDMVAQMWEMAGILVDERR